MTAKETAALVERLAGGDREALRDGDDRVLVEAVDLLRHTRRRYDTSFAGDLAARYVTARHDWDRARYDALDAVAYDRGTFLTVANRLLDTFRLFDDRFAGTVVHSAHVRTIHDFAGQRVRVGQLLLELHDFRLAGNLAEELVPSGDGRDARQLGAVLALYAAEHSSATVGQLLSRLTGELRASGAGRVAHWPQLMIYAAQDAAVGGTTTSGLTPRRLLAEVAACGDLPMIEFLQAGFRGSLAEISAIARKV